MLKNAVKNGAEKALAENAELSELVIKSEAYRLYGRSNVDRWISEELVFMVASGNRNNKRFIERKQLDAVAASSNRITYLRVADRTT